MKQRDVLLRLAALSLAVTLTAAGGLIPLQALAQAKPPVNVGFIYSKTGLLASYGAQWLEGFKVGLDFATNGTGTVNGHKIVVTERDYGGDPAKAVAAAKEFIGQGDKIIVGPDASGAAVQVAPLAKENNILLISGPAATDAITANNRNTFRAGRQTYQDVATSAFIVGNIHGKKILVFAQDSLFGKFNYLAVQDVLGARGGAQVSSLLVPLSANDFTPFAQKAKDARPDLIFLAWAGATAPAMWKSLDDAGVLASTRVVTGLDQRASYTTFAPFADKLQFLGLYVYECCKNKANDYLIAAMKKDGSGVPLLFEPDGFAAAQMVVRAVQESDGSDVGKMITALEGWKYLAPKGEQQIRASDHANLQPMFILKLKKTGNEIAPVVVKTIPANWVAPIPKPFAS